MWNECKLKFLLLSILMLWNVTPLVTQEQSDYERTPGRRNEPRSESSTQTRLSDADICNCTTFFKCDLNTSPTQSTTEGSTEETKASNPSAVPEDSDENGAEFGTVDIRNAFGSRSGSAQPTCKHYLEICCNHYQRTSVKQKPVEGPEVSPKIQHQCGRRNSQGVGFRIVGDVDGEAQMGEFTWMAAVTELSKDKQGSVYVCGGSLIHPRIVLTAAHCVDNKVAENLRIRAGEWDTQTEREDPFVHHDRQISKVIIHEDYTIRPVLKNDIALLLLSKDVPFARHVGTVCLNSDLQPSEEQRCFASGWGKHLYGKDGSYQSILKKVELPVVSQSECQSSLRETRLGPRFRLHNSFVCAGGEKGRDTCRGDGGSPLVCQIPGTNYYAQYGIVSWGLNCGDPIPGVYVNVPKFVPWIEDKMSEMGLDPSYFKLQ